MPRAMCPFLFVLFLSFLRFVHEDARVVIAAWNKIPSPLNCILPFALVPPYMPRNIYRFPITPLSSFFAGIEAVPIRRITVRSKFIRPFFWLPAPLLFRGLRCWLILWRTSWVGGSEMGRDFGFCLFFGGLLEWMEFWGGTNGSLWKVYVWKVGGRISPVCYYCQTLVRAKIFMQKLRNT